ncbi:hypothetical protein TNCV_3122091 [Trichonephila clavipes]|nr:hypothetical protein TNCV_3122091 [Trichonephila clavipes]
MLGTVNSDSNWLPWRLGFKKWGGSSPAGKARENSVTAYWTCRSPYIPLVSISRLTLIYIPSLISLLFLMTIPVGLGPFDLLPRLALMALTVHIVSSADAHVVAEIVGENRKHNVAKRTVEAVFPIWGSGKLKMKLREIKKRKQPTIYGPRGFLATVVAKQFSSVPAIRGNIVYNQPAV